MKYLISFLFLCSFAFAESCIAQVSQKADDLFEVDVVAIA